MESPVAFHSGALFFHDVLHHFEDSTDVGGILFRWEYFLNTDLVYQVSSPQVGQVPPLFVVREVCADAVDHHHHEGAVIHIQPVGAANEFICAVSYKGAVDILAQVWLVKSRHDGW